MIRRSVLLGAGSLALAPFFGARGAAGPAASGEATISPGSTIQKDLVEKAQRGTKIPALAAFVFTRTGEVLFQGASGVRRLGEPETARATDRWHLGSNTKAMRSVLYARLVEQGRAAWGARMPDLFPWLSLDPAWAEIQVEDLLSHRAGLDDDAYFRNTYNEARESDCRPLIEQRRDLARLLLTQPPNGKPGEYRYSNFGYILATAAMDGILRHPYEKELFEDVLKPLGIATAEFGPPKGAHQPFGHRYDPARQVFNPLPPGDRLAENPAVYNSAGGLSMSLPDYAKFLRPFMNDGRGLVSPDSYRRIVAPRGTGGLRYGLGWATETPAGLWKPDNVIGHEGTNGKWYTMARVNITRGIAIISQSNAGSEEARRACSYLRQEIPGFLASA
jgi:D-alanyl-D-alanine carboxypeptidase